MTHSILITKYLLKILESDEELMQMIPIDKFYPVDARLSSKFPFVVILRTSIMPQSSKDGQHIDTVNFSTIVVSDTYVDGITIADKVRETLQGNGWRDSEKHSYLYDINLETANETIYNDVFIQQLDFRCTFEWV